MSSGRRWRWGSVLLVLGLAVMIAAVATVVLVRRSRTVRWAEVMAATVQQETVNGVGRVFPPRGPEWALALWVQLDRDRRFPSNSLLLPVTGGKGARPSDEVVTRAEQVNFLSSKGGAVRLPKLAAREAATVGQPTEFAGRPSLQVTVYGSAHQEGLPATPEEWRFYVDPETKLVQGLDLLVGGRLAAKVEYRYNRPLPRGFTAT